MGGGVIMSEIIRGHDEIIRYAHDMFRSLPMPKGVQFQLSPPYAREIDAVFLEYVPHESLSASVVVPPKYANPAGVIQGGYLAVVFDHLIGPLSMLTAGALATSLDLATYFLAPVLPGERLTVVAHMRKAGRTAQYINADATNEKGILVATASSTILVIGAPR
jgi:uncharacterized protein (TIGR00369 family)